MLFFPRKKHTSLLPYDAFIWFPCMHMEQQQLFSLRRAAGAHDAPSAGASWAHRPCWLTLWTRHGWINGCSLITHTWGISGTPVLFMHQLIIMSLDTPPPPLPALSRYERMDVEVSPFSGLASHWPRFPFCDAWPHTAQSTRSYPPLTENYSTSARHQRSTHHLHRPWVLIG